MPDPRVLDFAFDYLSPYAYLAWSQLPALAVRHSMTLVPEPVLLAGLLHENGTKGPAEVPRKRSYVIADVARSAAVLGVPFALPPAHPFRPLLALRTTLAAPPEARGHVIDRLFAATWGGGAGCETAEAIAAALEGCGLDVASVLAQACSDAVKARLRVSTERALSRGAFGVPTMFAEGEMFFGLDSLPHLERRLAADPRMLVSAALLERWETLPATASRV